MFKNCFIKKIFYFFSLVFLSICLGCNRKPVIDGELGTPVICGIAIFILDSQNNYCKSIDNKYIYELNKNETYTILVGCKFAGTSADARILGDIANFVYNEDNCSIRYIGTEYTEPLYELLIKEEKEFNIEVRFKNFSLTATIIPIIDKE